jgi:hypothetical protein
LWTEIFYCVGLWAVLDKAEKEEKVQRWQKEDVTTNDAFGDAFPQGIVLFHALLAQAYENDGCCIDNRAVGM